MKYNTPRNSDEEKRLFELLEKPYVQTRYNPNFIVNKEDVEAPLPKVEFLCIITQQMCEEKIGEYERLAKGKGK